MKTPDVRTLTALAGVLLRCLVSFFPYSGESVPPRFGDYEAQRHWKEITYNLPVSEWYANSARNDAAWWPLDYPPLTAYHEWLLSLVSVWFEPASVALYHSRGYETVTHRTFMRLTVLASELLVYFLAVWKLSDVVEKRWRTMTLMVLILNPALIFVDHAHFQYNSVAIGFLLWSIFFVQTGRPYRAAILYTTSFLFKQTLLYFSPIFFAYMLGEALKLGSWRKTVMRVFILGLCVLGTIAAACIPIVHNCASTQCISDRMGMMSRRIFPFGRGIFEDYVANAWIVLNPILRIRSASGTYLQTIAWLSTILTVGCAAIPGFALLRNPRRALFPVGLVASSLSFYLFSWMVHEKAIILPLSALLVSSGILTSHQQTRSVLLRFIEASCLSLLPLMVVEGSALSGTVIFAIAWLTISVFLKAPQDRSKAQTVDLAQRCANLIAGIGCCIMILCQRPERYPYIGELVIMSGAFATFILTWLEMVRFLFFSIPTAK